MNDLCWHWNLTTPTGDCRCVFPLQRFLCCIRNIQYQCEFEQDCVASSLAVSSSQDDHNWYHARRSDGKVGMIPGNYVKERGQDNGKDVSAPKTPLKVAARTVDVPDQDETLTVKPTKRGEVELTDMQVWARPSKRNVSKSASVASDPVVVFWPLESIPRYSRTLTVQRYIMVTTNCCSVGVWRLIWTKHVSTVLPFVCMCVCVCCGSSATNGFIQRNVAQFYPLKIYSKLLKSVQSLYLLFSFSHDHIQCTNINKNMRYGENLKIVLNTKNKLKWQKGGRKPQKFHGPLSCRANIFQSK